MIFFSLRNVIIGVAQFRAATRQRAGNNSNQANDEADRISTGSGISLDSQNLSQLKSGQQAIRLHSSATLSPQSISNDCNPNGKSQSDSEAATASNLPTRISSSSDIGYGSMQDQKVLSDPDIDGVDVEYQPGSEKAKTAKFWGKMGQSLDQWVSCLLFEKIKIKFFNQIKSFFWI